MIVEHSVKQRIRLAAIGIILVLLSVNAASQPLPKVESVSPVIQATQNDRDDLDFWRWALTQGGLTIALLVLMWSYRRDMMQWTQESRSQRDDARADASRMQFILDRSTEAMSTHAVALARNTDSTHRLAHAVEKLDGRVERIEDKRAGE